ncbi:prolipoprotein diacylglyceryl transferase [Nitratifractor sp.]
MTSHPVWNVDPILLHLGPLQLRWYGLLFVGGLLLGYGVMVRIFRREGKDPALLDPLFGYLVAGIIVGARLAHCLLYEPHYYLAHPMEILFVWKGGLASHGGIVGAILALWLYTRRYRIDFLWLFSRLAIPLFLVAAFIRIGNFFNSEILGKASDAPWAIVFARYDTTPRHPVMLYESAGYLLIFALGCWLYRRWDRRRFTDLYPGIALIAGFSLRFVLEFFKMPQAENASELPLSMGQLLSIPFVLIGIGALLWGMRRYREGK